MRPVTRLPDHYIPLSSLDLSGSYRLLLVMQVAGLFALLVSGVFFLWLTFFLRPTASEILSWQGLFSRPLLLFGSLILSTVLMVVLHEAVHGLFFWLFTGRRPLFGFKGLYAYAASPPGTYLPRDQYLLVGIAPLVALSLAGTALLPFVPLAGLPVLLFFLIGNASGSVGDLLVIAWLLRMPPDTFLQDVGDKMTAYGPEPS